MSCVLHPVSGNKDIDMKKNRSVGVIGLGNMGSAIAKCISLSSFHRRITGFDIDVKKCAKIRKSGIKTVKDNCELVKGSDIVILAIKPQEINNTLGEIKNLITEDKLIISIAAGISTEYIEGIIGKARVVRVMPNIAILVKEGVSAICCGKYASGGDKKIVCEIFNSAGKTVIIPEKFMDTVTALSGSGPAYLFEIVNSLIKAGTKFGLSQNQAGSLVFQTVRGAITMLEKIDGNPVFLRDMVTSKKGTTIEGLKVLRKNHTEEILIKTVAAARKRSGELSKLSEKYAKN
jgi:pyrroline-5-carboxylate reductase